MRARSVILATIYLLAIVCFAETQAHATTKPDWINGNITYSSETNNTRQSCVSQKRVVMGYRNNTYPAPLTQPIDVCVFGDSTFQYAYYYRETFDASYYNIRTTESGVAVSFEGSNAPLVPIDNYPRWAKLLGATNGSFMLGVRTYSGSGYELRVYIDPIKHLLVNRYSVDHFNYSLDDEFDYTYRDADGKLVAVDGLGVSSDGHWLSFAVANFGIIRLDTQSLSATKVATYVYHSSAWPAQGAETAISNNGDFVAVAGTNVPLSVINIIPGCGDVDAVKLSSIKSSIDRPCPSRSLNQYIEPYSQTYGSSGVYVYALPEFSSDGVSLNLSDTHNLMSLSTDGHFTTMLSYLALGDSFASGEGDASLDGIDHYLFGTNIYGDYLHNVARENCHQSDRAYSMLIAGNMGLNRGSNMQTVACSGAVTYDVWSRDKANYIDPAYLGQSTEKAAEWGSSTPRLSTVNNAVDLQTQARADYIPGRVQQIEQVKKAQPEYATIMIGGNDLGFSSALTSCITNLPLNRTCDMATPNGMASKAREIYGYWDGTQVKGGSYDNLKQLYTDIQATSPLTKLYVIGYPKFLDDQVLVCPTSRFTLTLTERHSINQLLDYFNATIRSAAHDAGATYIDISSALGSDVACGRGGAITGIDDLLVYWLYTQAMQGKQYTINGMTAGLGIGTSLDLALLQSYFTDSITLGSSPNIAIHSFLQQMLHPNAYGHELIYKQLARGLGDELLASDACNDIVICPGGSETGRPDVALYIPGISMSENKIIKNGEGAVSVGRETDGVKVSGEFIKGQGSALIEVARDTLEKLIGGTLADTVSVALHSDPVDLGVMTLRTDGVYELSSAIVPASLPVGWHVVHILGHLSTGIGVDVYTPVFVRGPVDDYDDDKIIDTADTCAFGTASGKDTDLDGVDDECDISSGRYVALVFPPTDVSVDIPKSIYSEVGHIEGLTDPLVLGDNIPSGAGVTQPKSSTRQSESAVSAMLGLVILVALAIVLLGWQYSRRTDRSV